ncbi:hypothetical protein [Pigmentiphaga litoralis]|uniref:hypothetical protein n=1 Tax=Pigmentiphaga litoralis TaxID=516702 RepID=UPI003B43085F
MSAPPSGLGAGRGGAPDAAGPRGAGRTDRNAVGVARDRSPHPPDLQRARRARASSAVADLSAALAGIRPAGCLRSATLGPGLPCRRCPRRAADRRRGHRRAVAACAGRPRDYRGGAGAGGSGAVWWLLDGQPQQQAPGAAAVTLKLRENGKHAVTAMDEAGRYDSVSFTVRGLAGSAATRK